MNNAEVFNLHEPNADSSGESGAKKKKIKNFAQGQVWSNRMPEITRDCYKTLPGNTKQCRDLLGSGTGAP